MVRVTLGLRWVAVKEIKPWQSVMAGPFLFLIVSFRLKAIWQKKAGKEVLGEELFLLTLIVLDHVFK